MSVMASRQRVSAKSCLFIDDDGVGWNLAESPSEIAHLIAQTDPEKMLQLTIGNQGGWNGKPFYVRARCVKAISPPRAEPEDDE